MDILIRNATILCVDSPHHNQNLDVFISDGIIREIGTGLNNSADKTIAVEELYISIGLCDICTHGGEPGLEHRETMDSLSKSALKGGYTELVLSPNLKPVTQTKAQLNFLSGHSHTNGVFIRPAGALSVDLKGSQMTEIADMKEHGAIAITDGLFSVQDTGLLSRAMQYAASLGIPVIHYPADSSLSGGGLMHEGIVSTSLGLKGIPDIAESNMLQRDLLLAKHFLTPFSSFGNVLLIEHALSSKKSVQILQAVKSELPGLGATVAYLNLLMTDNDLIEFDTNKRVVPVLRQAEDRDALRSALKEGIIDAIVSNHLPLDVESKQVEFPYADPGAAGLETCLPACVDSLKSQIGLDLLIEAMTRKPRRLLQLPVPVIKEGEMANLCVFSTKRPWVFSNGESFSAAVNNPWEQTVFQTQILATLQGKNYYLSPSLSSN